MARKTRRRKKQLPFSREALSAIVVSTVEILIFIISIYVSSRAGDNVNRVFSAMGTICVFISVYYLVISLKQLAEHEYEMFTRIAALILTAAALLIWVSVYLVGLVVLFT